MAQAIQAVLSIADLHPLAYSPVNKLQYKLFQPLPVQKNVLYNILKVIKNPSRGKHTK